MSQPTVYLVTGSSGCHDDYRVWNVRAFAEKPAAVEHARLLNAFTKLGEEQREKEKAILQQRHDRDPKLAYEPIPHVPIEEQPASVYLKAKDPSVSFDSDLKYEIEELELVQ